MDSSAYALRAPVGHPHYKYDTRHICLQCSCSNPLGNKKSLNRFTGSGIFDALMSLAYPPLQLTTDGIIQLPIYECQTLAPLRYAYRPTSWGPVMSRG